jgi:hypothetical protein
VVKLFYSVAKLKQVKIFNITMVARNFYD